MITTGCRLIGVFKPDAELRLRHELGSEERLGTADPAAATESVSIIGNGSTHDEELKGARDHLLTLFGFTDGLGSGNSKNATPPRALFITLAEEPCSGLDRSGGCRNGQPSEWCTSPKGNPADLNRRGSTARQRGAKARSAEH